MLYRSQSLVPMIVGATSSPLRERNVLADCRAVASFALPFAPFPFFPFFPFFLGGIVFFLVSLVTASCACCHVVSPRGWLSLQCRELLRAVQCLVVRYLLRRRARVDRSGKEDCCCYYCWFIVVLFIIIFLLLLLLLSSSLFQLFIIIITVLSSSYNII